MKIFSKRMIEDKEITWVEPGQSVPMMQGMALNKLKKTYPSRKGRCGWMLWSKRYNGGLEANGIEPALPEACYYLLERNVKEYGDSVVAFKENGDNIEGYALFI